MDLSLDELLRTLDQYQGHPVMVRARKGRDATVFEVRGELVSYDGQILTVASNTGPVYLRKEQVIEERVYLRAVGPKSRGR